MRVLVTRPEADARRTAERLTARDHEPVVAPVLSIARTGDAPPPGPFDALIVTSANAIPALAERGDRKLPVFAVGGRTGDALAGMGFVDVCAAEGDGAALAAVVAQRLKPGARLLHAAGRDRKPEPVRSLTAAGFEVDVWTVYAARAAERLPETAEAALRERRLDAALHYSRRSAAILLDLVRAADLLDPLLAIAHFCLSPDVATPLRDAGARRIIGAERPNEEALLAKINRGGPHRKDRRKPPSDAGDGTNPPAEVSLSSPSLEQPHVTDTPPDATDLRPRRTGPHREPPTIDLKATVVPDAPRAEETPQPASASTEAAPSEATNAAEEPQAKTSPSTEPAMADLSNSSIVIGGSEPPAASTAGASPAADEALRTEPSGASSQAAPGGAPAEPAVKEDLPREPAPDVPPSAGATPLGDGRPDDLGAKAESDGPGVSGGGRVPTGDRATDDARTTASVEDRALADAAEAQVASSVSRPERRGPGVGALLGTGLLGGLLGAGLATLGQTYWASSRNQTSPRLQQLEQRLADAPTRDAVGALDRRLAAVDAEQKALAERLRAAQQGGARTAQDGAAAEGAPKAPDLAPALAAVTERLSALEAKAPDAASALAALTERFSLLEADVRGLAPLRDQVQAGLNATRALDQRLTETQGQVRTTLDAAVRGLDQRLTAALGQTRDQLRDQIQANAEATRTLERRSAELDQRLTTADQRLAALTQKVGDRDPAELAAAALRVSLADRLGDALRAGAPLGPALDALRRQNPDPQALAALEPYAAERAPSAAALAQDFKPLADRILAESRPASANAGWSDRLWRMADQVVTVRAAEDKGGGDAESLVARIQTALSNGALREAAAAWDALPESARRLSEDWGRRLKQRIAADEAAQKISERALSALNAPTR